MRHKNFLGLRIKPPGNYRRSPAGATRSGDVRVQFIVATAGLLASWDPEQVPAFVGV